MASTSDLLARVLDRARRDLLALEEALAEQDLLRVPVRVDSLDGLVGLRTVSSRGGARRWRVELGALALDRWYPVQSAPGTLVVLAWGHRQALLERSNRTVGWTTQAVHDIARLESQEP